MADLNLSPTPTTRFPWRQRLNPRHWSKRTRWISGITVGLLVLGGSSIAYAMRSQPTAVAVAPSPTPTATPTPTPTPTPIADPLNGTLYPPSEAAAFTAQRPVAVMVENHVEARPQAGLNEAEIIHEAMAEGGITRFMAVYLHNAPPKIGPVRSARKHFVEWAAEYNATYAHWGGSAEALDLLGTLTQPKNLDEFQHATAFYRDTSLNRSLEHTGFTSTGQLRQVNQQLGWETAVTFHTWPFKDDAPATNRPQAQSISLGYFGNPSYKATFTYRPETNDYLRATGGQPHLDMNGVQLSTKSIVVLFQAVQNYTDGNGHPAVHVTTIGSGKALVIQDGTTTEETWSKADLNSRTMITSSAGQEIPLDRGKIWIISAPIGSPVSY